MAITRACLWRRAAPSLRRIATRCSCIYADAAGDSAGAGYCAWTVAGDELLVVEGRWSALEREHLIIATSSWRLRPGLGGSPTPDGTRVRLLLH